ncbi:hypothetical protein HUJ05_005665 [Dendroctonus ponderosae]|nr:hypothetical protein HUJ05_005665 [Dendroctonus ponderosae]
MQPKFGSPLTDSLTFTLIGSARFTSQQQSASFEHARVQFTVSDCSQARNPLTIFVLFLVCFEVLLLITQGFINCSTCMQKVEGLWISLRAAIQERQSFCQWSFIVQCPHAIQERRSFWQWFFIVQCPQQFPPCSSSFRTSGQSMLLGCLHGILDDNGDVFSAWRATGWQWLFVIFGGSSFLAGWHIMNQNIAGII